MENKIIISWLRDNASDPLHLTTKAYAEGLSLLMEAKVKTPFYHHLKRAPINSCKCRLLYNQVRLLAKRCLCISKKNTANTDVHVFTSLKAGEYSSPWSELKIDLVQWELLPPVLKQSYFRKGKLYSTASQSYYTLARMNVGKDNRDISTLDKKANSALAKTIIMAFDEIGIIWEQIDYYMAHKKLPPALESGSSFSKSSFSDLSNEALLLRIKTRRSNVCTYRRRIEAASEIADSLRITKLENKLLAYQEELRILSDEMRNRNLK